jgi:SAM-dependent methyltransferase
LKEYLKNILKSVGIYYFLQGNYRKLLFNTQKIICRIRYSKFKGAGFTCNCCGASYTRFIPDYPSVENVSAINSNEVIAGYGENILCPNCLSTARERLIIALLKEEFKIAGKKILHFSPEKNIYNFLKTNNEIITADIEPLFYKSIDGKIKDEDATRLSFNDNSFDVVIGNHILEHIPDDTKAITEIYRVLKPGGRAILQIPYSTKISGTIEEPEINDAKKQSAMFGQKDHVRIYQLQNYVERLQSRGFKVMLIQYTELAAFYTNAVQHNEVFISILKLVNGNVAAGALIN